MKFINILKVLSIVLFASFIMVSCEKETIDDTTINEGTIDPPVENTANPVIGRSTNTGEDGVSFDCFDVLFSFTLVDIEDNEYVIENEDDFNNLLQDSLVIIVDFVYPVDIQYEDGNITTIEDTEEFAEAFSECLPNGWDEELFPAYVINDETSCLSIVYPISVSNIDGEIETAQSESELVALIAQEPYFFVFPFSLIDEDANTITVNDIDDLLEALITCNNGVDTIFWGNGVEYYGCYQLTFPFDVVLVNGSIVTVNDHMEYCDLMLGGQLVNFAFPLTLIDLEGNEVVANSQEELDALIMECEGWNPNFEVGDLIILLSGTGVPDSTNFEYCYDVNWPITANELDEDGEETGTSVVINDLMEAWNLFGQNEFVNYSVDYPIDVTMVENGSLVTITNTDQLLELLEDCY